MAHTPWHSGGTYTGQHKDFKGSYKSSGTGEQSAHNVNTPSEAEIEAGYMSSAGHNVKHNFNNSNPNIGNNNSQGFINQNNQNVNENNNLSTLDQIAEDNFSKGVFAENLKKAEALQTRNTGIWGLDKWSENHLGDGKIDTSEGVVDEILELHNAAKEMAKILGLDPNNKKDLRIALNFLSGDEHGSQKKLVTNNQQWQEILNLRDRKEGGWKTWGTGLRGDARWKGAGPLTKDAYGEAMRAMNARVQVGTDAFNYKRALINAHKPLRSSSPFEAMFGLFGAAIKANPSVVEWLNSHNEVDEIGVDENGIFNFELNGKKININDGTPFTKLEWDKFVIKDAEHKSDPVGGGYNTYAYDNTGVVDTDDDDEDEDDSKEVMYDSDLPAWYDFKLFEKMYYKKGGLV